MNNKKNKMLFIVAIITIILSVIGLTYAFFNGQLTGIFSQNAIVTSNTTDLLTFEIDNDIEFEVSQFDFQENGNNKSGDTYARAILVPNNYTGEATMHYYMYLNIEENGIDYSSSNTDEDPELMLQVFDSNNQLVTLSGLGNQVTVKGVTGYDITDVIGLVTLLDSHEIVATNNLSTTQEWKVVITLINLDINQNDNAGKEVEASIIMRRDEEDGSAIRGNLAVALKNEIELNSGLMKEYRGEGYYHDENDRDTDNPYFTRPIYYWDGNTDAKVNQIKEKWNVVFADSCWQIVRTTENGGIKLLYNGEAAIERDDAGNITYDCSTNRSANNVGINPKESISFDGSYYYGSSYKWDRDSQLFSLIGVGDSAVTMNSNNGESLEGKYTCKSTSSVGTCGTLYYIDEYISGSNANAISLVNVTYRDAVGITNYNDFSNSANAVGYMYGDTYANNTKTLNSSNDTIINSLSNGAILEYVYLPACPEYISYCTRYLTYEANMEVSPTYSYSNGTYTLDNPVLMNELSDKSTALNYFTCLFGHGSTCTEIGYLVQYNSNSSFHYMVLQNDEQPEDAYLKVGTSITDNNDGTYTINSPTTVKIIDNWMVNYANYVGYYICSDGRSTTCSYENMRLINNTSFSGYNYYSMNVSKYKVASSVTKSGNSYVLNNPVTINTIDNSSTNWITDNAGYVGYYICSDETSTSCALDDLRYITATTITNYSYYPIYIYSDKYTYSNGTYTLDMTDTNAIDLPGQLSNFNNIGKAHYTCFNITGVCNEIYYVYYMDGNTAYYLTLTNGKYVSTDESNSQVFENNNNVLYAMLHKNSNDSLIKTKVDDWYKIKLLNYTSYIDSEEIYCNKRDSINNYGSMNNNSDNMNTALIYENTMNNLNCYLKGDSFSADETTKGNGDLTYPVGLITATELNSMLFGNSDSFWTMTPHAYLKESLVYAKTNFGWYGSFSSCCSTGITAWGTAPFVSDKPRIRPAIALPSTSLEYSRGDGSTTNPYVIEVGNSITLNDLRFSASKRKAVSGESVLITSDKYVVGSFKLNGTTITGNTFIMPNEEAIITDVTVYKIKNNSTNSNVNIVNSAIPGTMVKISLINEYGYKINSFKMNGTTINGSAFAMPYDNVIITDVVIEDILTTLRNNQNYQMLDYIQFNGAEYIDTGIVPSNHMTEMKFSTNNCCGGSGGYLFADVNRSYWVSPNSGNYYYGTINGQLNSGTWTSGDHVIVYNGISDHEIILDNVKIGFGVNITSNSNLRIGLGDNTYYLSGKVYYVKIIDKSTNELVRYFVPVRRFSDNELGLYDAINDVFYTNQGSGGFSVEIDDKVLFNSGARIVTLSSRNYNVKNTGIVYVGYFYNGGYTMPLLVGSTPESVAFYTSYDTSAVVQSIGTVTYKGITYYVSGTGYAMGGNITDTSGNNYPKYTASTAQEAALMLLEDILGP